jgi:hypothetical protein
MQVKIGSSGMKKKISVETFGTIFLFHLRIRTFVKCFN